MHLRPLVCALDRHVLFLVLDLLRGGVLFHECVLDVPVGDRGFAYLLVADEHDFPGVVGHLVV